MATSEQILPYVSVGTALTDTSATTCYTCPTKTWAQVTLVNVCDSAGGSGAATVAWYDASANVTFTIVKLQAFAANAALDLTFDRLALDDGDEIRVTGANGYHVVVSAIENARRN